MAFSQPAAPLAQPDATRVDRSAWRHSLSLQPRLCQLDGAGATCNTEAGRIRQVREIEAGGLRERRGVTHVIDHDSTRPAGFSHSGYAGARGTGGEPARDVEGPHTAAGNGGGACVLHRYKDHVRSAAADVGIEEFSYR